MVSGWRNVLKINVGHSMKCNFFFVDKQREHIELCSKNFVPCSAYSVCKISVLCMCVFLNHILLLLP